LEEPLTQFATILDRLEARGVLYIQPFTYDTLVAFLDGYDCAIYDGGNASILQHFREWLHNKVGHHCSLHWSVVIWDLFAGKDESFAVSALFNLLREFIGDRSSGK
jgi:hypothetical protein